MDRSPSCAAYMERLPKLCEDMKQRFAGTAGATLKKNTFYPPETKVRAQQTEHVLQPERVRLVRHDGDWREVAAQPERTFSTSELVVKHLLDLRNETREMQQEVERDTHRLWACLKTSMFTCFSNGRNFNDGKTVPGMIHVSEPNTNLRIITHGPTEHLYVSIPSQYLAELRDQYKGSMRVEEIALRSRRVEYDNELATLCNALAQESTSKAPIGKLYADSLGTAIVAKLLSNYSSHSFQFPFSSPALSKSRFNRVREYIDANLSHDISLTDLAGVAGLSRMHFAGQFRRTTGLQPHRYLLQQRIEQAKGLLRTTDHRLVEIALSVGFKTQSHFTTVFKRFVGQTPAVWRAFERK